MWTDPISPFVERLKCDIDGMALVSGLRRTADRRRVNKTRKVTRRTRKKKKKKKKRKPVK
jgi:hypothetical protein